MKKTNLFSIITAGFVLLSVLTLSMTACDNRPDNDQLPPYEEPEEPDPEPDPEPEPVERRVKFVKTDGTGTGSSWDDAMSPDGLSAALKELNIPTEAEDVLLPNDTICMAAGTYILDKTWSNTETRIVKSVVIIGGFPADITGDAVETEYPSEHRTIITGDRNGDGIPNEGDVRTLSVREAGTMVTLKGIDLTCGYITQWGGAGLGIEGGNGTVSVSMLYCRVYNNFSKSGANYAGALCVRDNNALYCYKTEVTENKADSRGGGVCVSGGKLYMESSLINGNQISSDFGSAIHIMSGSEAYIVNSTITGNTATQGGAVNISNGTGTVAFISSTIAGNVETNTSYNQGVEIRCETPNLKMVNCIVANSDATRYAFNIQGSGNAVFAGGNVLGTVNGANTSEASDVTGKSFIEIFAGNTLADNGGYPQTLMPAGTFAGASQATLTAFLQNYAPTTPFSFDLKVDQRGTARNADAATPGACEK
jgi:hypothetical protein